MNVNLNFYLDTNKRKVERTIFLHIRNKSKIYKISTGKKINPEFWNNGIEKPIKRNYPLAPELNAYLKSYKNHIEKIILEIEKENPFIKFDELARQLKDEVKGNNNADFFIIFQQYINLKKANVSKAFITKHNTIIAHLKEFEKQKQIKNRSFKITFDNIDLMLLDNFHNFLIAEKNLTNNYIKKLFSFLKTFLRFALERDYTDNNKFEKHKNLKEIETDNIALTGKELKRIIDADLNEKLSKTRDIFLFQCYTGQRFSDIERFNIADVKNNIWHLQQKKTKKIVEIPLLEPAINILNKYNGILPLKSSQKINNDLKEIGKIAGIDETVTVNKYIGADVITERKPKYELLTTHVARRTFVTILSNAKVNQQVIQAFTGHGTGRMVSKYYKGIDTDIIKQLSDTFSN